ncbi:---NA--- [Paramuricea clavata]|uniref:---NA n=1 Tax=Paramuricea clavata TaxID=317549 RepID=A0A7D9J1H1_PARCT|nr:---NA--- [Paramuricea clavata]
MDITKALKKYILISGIGFLPLGFVVIICDSMTHAETEDSLKPRRSGTTFWVGLPYFVLGFFMIYLSRNQKKTHVKVCRIVSILCFVLSMVAVVFEGPDWNYYVTYSNYVCEKGSSSTCNKTTGLSALFGSITVAAIIAILLCISNILICNWLLFRMSVETPEMDFERLNRKQQTTSTQVTEDSENIFKTQGYHTCWTDDKETKQQPLTPEKEAIQEKSNEDTLPL